MIHNGLPVREIFGKERERNSRRAECFTEASKFPRPVSIRARNF